MERVDVYRGRGSTDRDGNAVQGPLGLWRSFQALVAPDSVAGSVAADSAVDSTGVTWDHTIYIRCGEPTGILDTDVIGVRGRRVPVDGVVEVWDDPQGRHVGDVIHVRLREG